MQFMPYSSSSRRTLKKKITLLDLLHILENKSGKVQGPFWLLLKAMNIANSVAFPAVKIIFHFSAIGVFQPVLLPFSGCQKISLIIFILVSPIS